MIDMFYSFTIWPYWQYHKSWIPCTGTLINNLDGGRQWNYNHALNFFQTNIGVEKTFTSFNTFILYSHINSSQGTEH